MLNDHKVATVQNITVSSRAYAFIQFYGVLASFYGLWSVFRADFESESVLVSSESGSQPRKVPLLKAVFAPLLTTMNIPGLTKPTYNLPKSRRPPEGR